MISILPKVINPLRTRFKKMRLRGKISIFIIDNGKHGDAVVKASAKGKAVADQNLNSTYYTSNNAMRP